MSETALISNPLDYCPFMMIIEKKNTNKLLYNHEYNIEHSPSVINEK